MELIVEVIGSVALLCLFVWFLICMADFMRGDDDWPD